MVSFLHACGVRDDHVVPWLRAWERVADHEHPSTRGNPASAIGADGYPDQPLRERSRTVDPQVEVLRNQISQLNADNSRLRLQLADQRRPRVEQPRVEESSSIHSGNAPALHSPIARRRELGILLRAIREERGLTIEQVAEHLMCTVNKVKRMESSFRAGTLRDVRDLCNLYGVIDEAERGRIMNLAIEGKQQGWWQSYHLAYGTYVGLETEAVVISAFQSSVLHGLLQTADYARAGHEAAMPRLSPDQIDMQIEAKLTRQRILTRDKPPRVTVVLDEAALHRAVGGNLVMAAQLTKILDLSALPNVVVQILPFELGAHPALESNFTILGLPNSPEIVFVEGLIG
jgi:transcriptional regulator with XRE-family HTH domain